MNASLTDLEIQINKNITFELNYDFYYTLQSINYVDVEWRMFFSQNYKFQDFITNMIFAYPQNSKHILYHRFLELWMQIWNTVKAA